MQSLEGIRRSISTAEDLQSVVKMMKGVAAANIREFERAVASLADYSRAIELGIQTLLSGQPERLVAAAPGSEGHLGAVVFGSDQGMCGRFNQQIATHAVREIKELAPRGEDRTILIVGTRILALLEMDGFEIGERVATTTSLAGITSLVQEILMHVEAWRSDGRADGVVLYYNEALGARSTNPTRINSSRWISSGFANCAPASGRPTGSPCTPSTGTTCFHRSSASTCTSGFFEPRPSRSPARTPAGSLPCRSPSGTSRTASTDCT